MNLREEFRRLADECRQTARLAKDPVDRARWESLAESFDHSSRPPTGPFAAAANASSEPTGQRRFGQAYE
jgi:hypothetical protein